LLLQLIPVAAAAVTLRPTHVRIPAVFFSLYSSTFYFIEQQNKKKKRKRLAILRLLPFDLK